MLRHILVPLDGSSLAAAAFPYAVALARVGDARISLLAVVDPLPADGSRPSAAALEGVERQVTESTAYLESVATTVRTPDLSVATVIRHGNPASAILAYAEEAGCGLVVMGTHGRTGLARARAGSVAQHVLRHAVSPTLVVPPAASATTGAPAIAGIAVTLDGSSLAEDALPVAAQLATALAVPLTLLRVIPALTPLAYGAYGGWGGGYADYYPESVEQEAADDRAVADYLTAMATRLRAPGLDVRTHAERGATSQTAELIAAALTQGPAGLAVMASHGRGGVLRWALGSTVEGVLDLAPCPILVMRAGALTGTASAALPVGVAAHAD